MKWQWYCKGIETDESADSLKILKNKKKLPERIVESGSLASPPKLNAKKFKIINCRKITITTN